MVLQHRLLRTSTAVAGLVSLLVLLPGCPLSPDGGGGKDDEGRIPPRNSVSGAVQQYEFIWKNKRYDDYVALLHDDFEYFPTPSDLGDPNGDLAWITGDSYGRTEELGMARNMFDENFVSQKTGNAIDTIDMTLEVQSQTDSNVNGVIESTIRVHAVAQVLWAANSGLRSDVRFEFLVVPDPDEPGLYQIKEQRELTAF